MSAREVIDEHLWTATADPELARSLLDSYRSEIRAEVLAEAADAVECFDYPSAGALDEPGVLEQVELAERVQRALAAELRAMADGAGKDTPAGGESTQPADFFQPGRAYTEDAPFRAPEDRPNFQCIALATHPTTGDRRAFGFEQPGAGRPWKSSSLRDEEWADGWTDITDTTTRKN